MKDKPIVNVVVCVKGGMVQGGVHKRKRCVR